MSSLTYIFWILRSSIKLLEEVSGLMYCAVLDRNGQSTPHFARWNWRAAWKGQEKEPFWWRGQYINKKKSQTSILWPHFVRSTVLRHYRKVGLHLLGNAENLEVKYFMIAYGCSELQVIYKGLSHWIIPKTHTHTQKKVAVLIAHTFFLSHVWRCDRACWYLENFSLIQLVAIHKVHAKFCSIVRLKRRLSHCSTFF